MPFTTQGLHHLTGIVTQPQANIEFYVRVLGLRLLKRTVNYDDPLTYQFYYGDALGTPGTLLTFFAWPGAGPAVRGTGEAAAVTLKVPPGALPAWAARLKEQSIPQVRSVRFGEEVISFTDPDGILLELTEAPLAGNVANTWPGSPIPQPEGVQGLHSATVLSTEFDRTAELLAEMGLTLAREEAPTGEGAGRRARFQPTSAGAASRSYLDLLEVSAAVPGRVGAGSLHQIAFAVADLEALETAREHLAAAGRNPTAVKDRYYFQSVYFREPGGTIFELSTVGPGFMIDEAPEELGGRFRLPPWLQDDREFLRGRLPVTASPEYAKQYG